ncbi:hypothetical protein BLA24_29265 [Streptomyces cinnamoneus]|uniref:Uncharacterized protein n=1 Tax=Streptomyces cinnamoneus TaxID=53446 RepID=A0A2G1XBA0_STRCJ|nr:hypothetical protein [Streptomyces cinnamoneus]PHQ48459.1 hypothetical protein BLA24_29265 [Streptomyces cinnamoneus]PPT12546.1 hypothetical protein CYQ11_06210 [Streptomyces cinnamoneus]
MTRPVIPSGALPRHAAVTRAQYRSFAALGHVALPGLWDRALAGRLAAEARARHPFAEIPRSGPRTPVSARRTARRGTPAASGRLLARVHLSLVGTARAVTGRLLVPTFAAYGYYEDDDEVFLHVDTELCDLTLLTTAFGEVGPLHVHPGLIGSSMEQLGALESDPAWDRTSGTRVTYPATGVTALNGHVLPHHRPGRPVPGGSAVAALCYRALF